MLNDNLMRSLASLDQKLSTLDGMLYREQGENLVTAFSQDLYLDNLTTKEQPIQKFEFAFKSFSLTDGTDNDTYIYIILGKPNSAKRGIKFKNNATFSSDFLVPEITVYSPAQASKKITLNLFKDATVSTGSLLNSGTVSISPSTSFSPIANPTLAAATAALLIASNPTSKRRTLQNNDTASIFIGPSNVTNSGATRGLELLAGASVELFFSGDIYGYSVLGFAAGGLTILEET